MLTALNQVNELILPKAACWRTLRRFKLLFFPLQQHQQTLLVYSKFVLKSEATSLLWFSTFVAVWLKKEQNFGDLKSLAWNLKQSRKKQKKIKILQLFIILLLRFSLWLHCSRFTEDWVHVGVGGNSDFNLRILLTFFPEIWENLSFLRILWSKS